ncbi:MAG: ABC transporter ATP-binding protein, partial [Syntrophomonadaceae bacterium]|nr:ABC transporter ATP-binding protein [Syntrophomonadaceae bacterium]
MAKEDLASFKLDEILAKHTYARDFFISLGINEIDSNLSLKDFVWEINYDVLEDAGLNREQLIVNFLAFINRMEALKKNSRNVVESITIIGGNDKFGNAEDINLELKVGEVISIVGPTGSG